MHYNLTSTDRTTFFLAPRLKRKKLKHLMLYPAARRPKEGAPWRKG
jgi:hypothetical protein